MKHLLFFLAFIFLICPSLSFSQDVIIKSLQTYKNNQEIQLPVIIFSKEYNDKLKIEFDVKANDPPNLIVVFKFCDRNWNPYKNYFLTNDGKDRGYNFNYSILPNSVNEANYHYKGEFPSKKDFVNFPFSGNWRFYITESNDTSKVYASGKFYIIYPEVVLNSFIITDKLEGTELFPTDLKNTFNVTTNFEIPNELFPGYINEVRIIENHKINYPIIINRDFNTLVRQYYWDANRKFTFTARDIKPNNEYRQLNFMNTNRFSSKNVSAQYDGIEYSRFFQQGDKDLNGGKILKHFNDSYANYLEVNFSFRSPEKNYGDIFLVGSFNDWTLSNAYKMNKDNDLYTYGLNLKRGIYDYQYVATVGNSKGVISYDWQILEGNSWDTINEYHIFLYYNEPDLGGYDRIIGYTLIESK
ncbi:MAG: hypothetical protein CO128_07560 [Ignavibacteriales bacterium CG_4_9_14_3_um_filter_30_11]|nr:MAG: hypothetical protein CO128_07560 [Ignavibacteriales bacterium CG_4_9_14_3_um_filter_30_11]